MKALVFLIQKTRKDGILLICYDRNRRRDFGENIIMNFDFSYIRVNTSYE